MNRKVPSNPQALLRAAPQAPLPDAFTPQLATLADAPPTSGDWAYEIKFDGYRILARIDRGNVRLFTRNGNDWTDRLTSLAAAIGHLPVKSGWLDAEAVVLDSKGLPNFNALQNAFDANGTEHITLFMFDAPYLDGRDLRQLPLRDRRMILQHRLTNLPDAVAQRIRFSDAFDIDGGDVLQAACRLGLEGVMAKDQASVYEQRRNRSWLKLKCHHRQEFVIGGFTDRGGVLHEVGALLLGVYDDDGALRYAGSVGTGWNAKDGAALWSRLHKLAIARAPFHPDHSPTKGRWSKRSSGDERWVRPELIAEVSFAEWTPDGSVRHASYEGLRADKDPRSVRREGAAAVPAREHARAALASHATRATLPAPSRHAPPPDLGKLQISNGERVIDASTGATKLDLVTYYAAIAPFILPHLRARPISLVRGPQGIAGKLFFQKHADQVRIPGVGELPPELWAGHQPLLEIPSATALLHAAQMNVIELHTWNARASSIDRPDRVIFDLDPGEGVSWAHIQEGATLTRVLLDGLGLQSWIKTSGGKGLHIVVPLAARQSWEAVHAFSKAAVEHMARTIPSRFVAKSGGGNRIGKIFVDYLRNGHGATTAAAFSARARPGLGVSMPIAWEQLAEVTGGDRWNIATAPRYVQSRANDPWKDYWTCRQTLTKASKVLDSAPR